MPSALLQLRAAENSIPHPQDIRYITGTFLQVTKILWGMLSKDQHVKRICILHIDVGVL
jgi:hypothetical protein